jgi:hypothetical protein
MVRSRGNDLRALECLKIEGSERNLSRYVLVRVESPLAYSPTFAFLVLPSQSTHFRVPVAFLAGNNEALLRGYGYLRGELAMKRAFIPVLALAAMTLSACITTDMQGYADRQLPQHPVQRIVALVAAPVALASSLQSSILEEAKKHGVFAEDAFLVLPPTRTYSDAEIKAVLVRDGIDAILILTVGDTGVQKEYAGTVFFGNSVASLNATGTSITNGNMTNLSMIGTSNSTMTATATPTYHYSRQTAFQARLVEASSGRALWVGNGQVQAGGLLFMGNGVNAISTATAIFNDLQTKGLISPVAS